MKSVKKKTSWVAVFRADMLRQLELLEGGWPDYATRSADPFDIDPWSGGDEDVEPREIRGPVAAIRQFEWTMVPGPTELQ